MSRLFLIVCAFCFTVAGGAVQAANISSSADLAANSVVEGGDTYALNSGDYTVNALVNIGGDPVKHLAVDSGVSVTVDGAPGVPTMFAVDTLHLRGGSVTASGGASENYREGLQADILLDAGELRVKGGDGYKNFGVFLSGTGVSVTVNGGSLHATGSDNGEDSPGVRGLTNAVSQTGGTVYATGGGGTYNNGIDVEDYIQSGGKLVARSGTGRASHGMYVSWDLVVGDTLVVQRGGTTLAASVVVGSDDDADYGNKLEFRNGSKLVLDLAGEGRLPVIWANKAEINGTVGLELSDAATLATGDSVTHDFLITQYGITGEFAFANSSTLDITIAKSEDDKNYSFTYSRHGTGGDLVKGLPSLDSNSFNLLQSLDPLYGTAIFPEVNADLTKLDFMTSQEEIAAHANYMVQKYTPIDSTRIVNTALNMTDMVSSSMVTNLFAPTGNQLASAAARSSNALASIASPSGTTRSFWLSPLAQWTRTRPLSREFVKANENTYGVGMGFGIRQDNNFALGAGLHYLRSELNSHTADVDSDIFGFSIFGRKYFANRAALNPFVQGGFGYSFSDSKQVRKLLGNHSSPDTHILNGNLAVGADIGIGRVILTPKVGMDYNYIKTGSYKESGANALSVRRSELNSLRGIVGVGLKSQVTDCLYLTANADYRHEFGDRNATTRSAFTELPAIEFVTRGEKRSRSSGVIGGGLGWQARSNLLVTVNYDFGIAEKQQSHAIAARFVLDF